MLYPDVSVSNLKYTLGVYRYTGISVSNKVYEDLLATLFPGVSVSNPSKTACHPECFLVYFVADRYSLVYTLGDRPLYTGLLTDIPGNSVAYRSSYTLSLTNITVYTPGDDRPLYPRLQINILGNSVADMYLSLTGIQVCLFMLMFYGPVNPMGSCQAWSIYLTTRLLGRLSPLSG